MFLGLNLKNIWSYLKSTHFNLSKDKTFREREMSKFQTKNAILSIFCQKCLIWVFLGWNLKTTFSYLKSAPSTKMPKFATKKALFASFWTQIWKQYCHIWDQHSRICLIETFLGKVKMPTFLAKNAVLDIFFVTILKKYFHIWNQLPQKCIFAKFH